MAGRASLGAEDDCLAIGRGLRVHRMARDMTQEELATRSGVSQSSVKRIEASGKGSLEDVLSLGRCLGIRELFSPDLLAPPPPTSIDDVLRENRMHGRKRASARVVRG